MNACCSRQFTSVSPLSLQCRAEAKSYDKFLSELHEPTAEARVLTFAVEDCKAAHIILFDPCRNISVAAIWSSKCGAGDRPPKTVHVPARRFRRISVPILNHTILLNKIIDFIGAPKGNRTPVFAVKGRRPRPLDDGRSASRQAAREEASIDGVTRERKVTTGSKCNDDHRRV